MPRLAAALAVLALPLYSRGSEHDKFVMTTKMHHSPQAYAPPKDAGAGPDGARRPSRRLQGSAQTCAEVASGPPNGPLRIGFELLETEGVRAEHVDLARGLMENATRYWGSVLRVRQATEPLRVHPGTSWATYGESRIYRDASDPTMCGEEVQVPSKYVEPLQVCQDFCAVEHFGCDPGSPCVQGGKCVCDYDDWVAQGASYCCKVKLEQACIPNCSSFTWDRGVLRIAKSGDSGYPYCTSRCRQIPGGPGAENMDLLLFVQVKDTPSCLENEGLQAYASTCHLDQCDRPIFGYVIFCKSKLSLEADQLANQLSTAVHEVAHVLGFSSGLFKYFRDPQGNPLIQRDASDPTKFASAIPFDCDDSTNKVVNWGSGASKSYVDLSPRIANKFDERGFSKCGCPIGSTTFTEGACFVTEGAFKLPHCVVKMTLPTVVQKAREHFDCSDLEGAELENQDTSSCVVFGSHWEGRLFNNELMAAVSTSGTPAFVSSVTLALFQDSGWYDVNWSRQDELVKNVHWGYKQGCGFARERCVEDGVSRWPRMFCASDGEEACSLDRRLVRKCAVRDADPASVPPVFDYFSGSGRYGPKSSLEYCPTYSVRYSNRVCTSAGSFQTQVRRETTGAASRCFMSTLHEEATTLATPHCYHTACAQDANSYRLSISDGKGGMTPLGFCTAAGQRLTTPALQGHVECAAPAEICGVVHSRHLDGLDMRVVPASAPGEDAGVTDAATTTSAPPAANGSTAADRLGDVMPDAAPVSAARARRCSALAAVLAMSCRRT